MFQTIRITEKTDQRAFFTIICAVVFFHAAFILWVVLANDFTKPKAVVIPKRLVVQTVSLSTPTVSLVAEQPLPPLEVNQEEAVLEEVKPVKPKPAPPAPKVEPKKPEVKKLEPKKIEPKKVEPKKVEQKKVETKKVEPPKPKPPVPKPKSTQKPEPKKVENKVVEKPAPKQLEEAKIAEAQAEKAAAEKAAAEKVEKARQQKLISEAQERIAKIGKTSDKLSANPLKQSTMPVNLTSLNIDALPSSNGSPLSDRELSYRDELAGRLKLLLKLPEYGEVKIKLTLARSGKVVKVVVIKAESETNKKHIEKTLPSLTFPGFGQNFGSDPEYTFVITLSNE